MRLRIPGNYNLTSPSHTRVSDNSIRTSSCLPSPSSSPSTRLSCLRRKSLFDSPARVLKKKIVRKEGRQDISSGSSPPRSREMSERSASCDEEMNVLQWMHDDAPRDVVPKILLFLGSRKIAVLSRTCRSWRDICLDDAVWRTASEDLRKWKSGDEIPSSWLQYYKDNPCVPIDYNSIESALRVSTNLLHLEGYRVFQNQHMRSIRILLCPGRYSIEKAITIHTFGTSEVTIETLDTPLSHSFFDNYPIYDDDSDRDTSGTCTPRRTRKMRVPSASSLRSILLCRSSSALPDSSSSDDSSDSESDNIVTERAGPPRCLRTPLSDLPATTHSRRATIILNTRKRNEPLFRVRQGKLNLRRLSILHNCTGTDIWNGNAAVQVQPPFDTNDMPAVPSPPSIAPFAHLSQVEITSLSGRGVVAIDGGKVQVDDSYLHRCAATGLYVGGPGSFAAMERTDVLDNGHGNTSFRNGITRGHSGVYLEQGVTVIKDSNISNNSLTGISAVSTDNAILTVEGSDLVGNGSIQLEMPPTGSLSRSRSISRDNYMSSERRGWRSRSGLVVEETNKNEEDLVLTVAGRELTNPIATRHLPPVANEIFRAV